MVGFGNDVPDSRVDALHNIWRELLLTETLRGCYLHNTGIGIHINTAETGGYGKTGIAIAIVLKITAQRLLHAGAVG